MRTRCSVFIALSLDGYIARSDGSIDWLSLVARPNEDYGYAQFHASIDALVIGRKTYETALGFDPWPYAGKRCVVMTRSERTSKHGEEFHSGDPNVLVDRLSREGVAHAYVDGGDLISQFIAATLIDDMTLSIIPILLGEGARLFAGAGREIPLTFVDSRAFESGLVQLKYRLTAT
jgi:dihydrofolate reductase